MQDQSVTTRVGLINQETTSSIKAIVVEDVEAILMIGNGETLVVLRPTSQWRDN